MAQRKSQSRRLSQEARFLPSAVGASKNRPKREDEGKKTTRLSGSLGQRRKRQRDQGGKTLNFLSRENSE